ncbi:biotin--[acetyl-CoA-carboxylase] ligase [Flavobacterium sp.]|uniref:biotin--[acetyl-CoA-carboxylase] ligase n=1 Tax=Flavobacterium sp. TaxID=239 RepID=UPI0037514E5F
MKIIKLSAIDSTNDFLKDLSKNEALENFTIVVAQEQTKGRGQMGSSWSSEIGKNLIMSVLIKNVLVDITEIFHLNVAISCAIIKVLNEIDVPKLSIKWPNDIMSEQNKIAGILIENSIKSDNTIESIVGIGFNVNQKNFENLPNASSISTIMKKDFDLDDLMHKIIIQIKKNCGLILSKQTSVLWQDYHFNLFKIGVPTAFENVNKIQFMGIIQKVNNDGLLQVILEDDTIVVFGIKEVKMLY